MNGFNRVMIIGNLTRDPDIRRTVNKKTFARLAVAVGSRYRDANGEYQESTDYFNAVAWGSTADVCDKYLKKGSPVFIEGRLKTGSYEAKDGSGKRYTTDIWIDRLIMLGSGKGSSGGQSSSSSSPQSYGADLPASSDFGTNIGENGFGGESFTQDFGGNDNNNVPGGDTGTDIPF